VVRRHEGFIGSFAGDALLAFFGAPRAHEDDPERAVRAALEMLAEFPDLQASVGENGASLSLRIGIDTGTVLARQVDADARADYAVMGNAVNMAQRLQSQAPKGGCWIGGTTAALVKEAFELEDLGGLIVKGRDEPLPAFAVVRAHDTVVARRRRTAALLHGRDTELGALRSALAGPGLRTLLVRGEPGAGKSRLLEALRDDWAGSWWEGGCVSSSSESYRPWKSLLASVPDDSEGLEVVRGTGGPADPMQRRVSAARDVAAVIAASVPAVVVLEDLHWADRPTLDLLGDLVWALADQDVLLLLTSRDPLPDVGADEVVLGPLPENAVAGMVEDVLGGAPPVHLVADLATRSGGNPLFLGELALALADRGLVSTVEGGVLQARANDLAAVLDLVPDSLEGLIGARIDALPASAAALLSVVAVLGAPVDRDHVAAVAAEAQGSTVAEVDAAWAQLVAAELVSGAGFSHAVVRDVAYGRLSRRRRRDLHRDAAAAGPGTPRYQAEHLYLAGGGPRAADALVLAADTARAAHALDEAVLHLTREVELRRADSGQRAVLPDRLTVLGEVLETLGRYADAEPLLREAIDLGGDVRATRALAGCLRRLGRYDEVLALEALGDDAEQLALLDEERAWSLAATGRHDEALQVVDRAPPSPRIDGRWALVRAYCLSAASRPDEAVDEARLAMSLLTDQPASQARALRLLGDALWRAGDAEAAEAVLHEGLDVGERVGAWEEVAACRTTLATLLSTVARLQDALDVGRDAMVLADRMKHRFGRVVTRANLADFSLLSGDLANAEAWALEAQGLAQEAGLEGLAAISQGTLAAVRLAQGDSAAALSLATTAATSLERVGLAREADEVWATAARAAAEQGVSPPARTTTPLPALREGAP
jgi:tetratricopeptide (TPR) repeat protein